MYDSQINKVYLDLQVVSSLSFSNYHFVHLIDFMHACQLNSSINNIITRLSNMTIKCKIFILPPLPSVNIKIASTWVNTLI